jgi:hypothetical protein
VAIAQREVMIVAPAVLALAIEPAVMLAAASARGAEVDSPHGETRALRMAVESPLLIHPRV